MKRKDISTSLNEEQINIETAQLKIGDQILFKKPNQSNAYDYIVAGKPNAFLIRYSSRGDSYTVTYMKPDGRLAHCNQDKQLNHFSIADLNQMISGGEVSKGIPLTHLKLPKVDLNDPDENQAASPGLFIIGFTEAGRPVIGTIDELKKVQQQAENPEIIISHQQAENPEIITSHPHLFFSEGKKFTSFHANSSNAEEKLSNELNHIQNIDLKMQQFELAFNQFLARIVSMLYRFDEDSAENKERLKSLETLQSDYVMCEIQPDFLYLIGSIEIKKSLSDEINQKRIAIYSNPFNQLFCPIDEIKSAEISIIKNHISQKISKKISLPISCNDIDIEESDKLVKVFIKGGAINQILAEFIQNQEIKQPIQPLKQQPIQLEADWDLENIAITNKYPLNELVDEAINRAIKAIADEKKATGHINEKYFIPSSSSYGGPKVWIINNIIATIPDNKKKKQYRNKFKLMVAQLEIAYLHQIRDNNQDNGPVNLKSKNI